MVSVTRICNLYFSLQPMPEATTDIEFVDATVGMNIPKNFIPSIEKVTIFSCTLTFLHGKKIIVIVPWCPAQRLPG